MLYPQQNDKRNVLDLSGIWDFQIDPDEVGESESWFNGLKNPRAMAVPSSWNEIYDDIRDYLGVAWYVQQSYVPAGWQGQRVMLRVGSANYAAKVWINGELVGEHEGGHLPFEFDVTDKITWDGSNTIAIRVENHLSGTRVPAGNVRSPIGGFMGNFPATTFDFFPYCGLHRAVQLYSVPQQRIDDVTVTTDIDGASGIVTVDVVSSGASSGSVSLSGEDGDLTAPLTFSDGKAQARLNCARCPTLVDGRPVSVWVDGNGERWGYSDGSVLAQRRHPHHRGQRQHDPAQRFAHFSQGLRQA